MVWLRQWLPLTSLWPEHLSIWLQVLLVGLLLGVAENHRWHHKREYEDAQVNFGEFWMIWDLIFATCRYQANGVRAGEVGIRETMTKRYVRQILWPFTKR